MQVVSALEKLSTRERFLNSQCEHLTAEYREAKEGLCRLQVHFNQKQDAAAELENGLARVDQVGQRTDIESLQNASDLEPGPVMIATIQQRSNFEQL